MKLQLLFTLLILSQISFSQKEIKLYDGKPKGSEDWHWSEGLSEQNEWNTKAVYNVTEPTITAYLPPYYLATGTAVIIAPGGGYHILSIDSEGVELAKWLNSKGIAAFVLKYRLTQLQTDDPVKEIMTKKTVEEDATMVAPLALADGLSAVKYVREHAEEFDIHPDKIGFMGFSAGGCLTLNVAKNATAETRPNFIAPIYPWNVGIIGESIPKDTTPVFIAVAADDPLQLMPFSLETYQKWVAAGHPAELHIYEQGGHGFGMRTKNLPSDTWYERFGDWLHMQGYLKKLYPNKYEKLYGQDAVAKGKKDRIKRMQTDYAQLDRYKAANEILAPPKPNEKRVVFLGNSITEAWVNVDSAFFADNNFIGRGISGQTSPQLLLRFRQDVLDLQPKALVINVGTNDIAENTGPYDPDFTMQNIKSMVELARANDIKVILTAVLPATGFEWNRKLDDRSSMIVELNKRIASFAKNENLPFVDYHTAMKNDKNGMDKAIAADGVHPTKEGYIVMKQLLFPVIEKTIK